MNSEIEYIAEVLVQNEYPLDIVQSNICAKIVHFYKPNTYAPEDCPVCLQLLWIGDICTGFARLIPQHIKYVETGQLTIWYGSKFLHTSSDHLWNLCHIKLHFTGLERIQNDINHLCHDFQSMNSGFDFWKFYFKYITWSVSFNNILYKTRYLIK